MTTTAGRAEETLLTHAADEEGWCAFHLRHFGLHVPAGKCAAFLMATKFLRDSRSREARRRPPRLTFSRPS